MTVREYIQWLKLYELKNEEREKATKGNHSGGMSWEQQKHNIMIYNELQKG